MKDIKWEDILDQEDRKYIRVLRLLQLIDGVNKSLENSQKIQNKLMQRQYEHLKQQYTKELLEVLTAYKLPLQLAA